MWVKFRCELINKRGIYTAYAKIIVEFSGRSAFRVSSIMERPPNEDMGSAVDRRVVVLTEAATATPLQLN